MAEHNIAVGHSALFSILPANLFPIFFLIFQENEFIVQVLSDFYPNLFSVVWLASNRETLDCIGDITDGIFLRLSVFGLDSGVLIVFLHG